MNRRLHGVLCAVLLIALSIPALAQTPAAAAAPTMDPEAMAALDRMGEFLRSLKAYRVQAVTTRDTVTNDGQLIQRHADWDVLAQSPNRLRMSLASDRKERIYFFDGKSFTIYSPQHRYYASVAGPATTRELAVTLADDYDIELPLEDLFWWGTERVDRTGILGGELIGPSAVEGTTCDHYAFRQADVDWQIWIQAGSYPLPRRLVIATKTDEARPQFSATYTWDLAPSYNDASFQFVPPPGAARIAIAKANPAAGGGN
jgi:hypothetical protein